MKHVRGFSLAIAIALGGAASLLARDARAGASCTNACSGPAGQPTCGSIGLGCPPGGGQCINCRNDNDCQPGGMCSTGQCINLSCQGDGGTINGMDATSGSDALSGVDAGDIDASADSGPIDSGTGVDAGGTNADAGGTNADAGGTNADAAAGSDDASSSDSGSPSDAGSTTDGALRTDASNGGTTGVPHNPNPMTPASSSSCSCSAARGTPVHVRGLGGLGLIFGLVFARRRRGAA